MIVRMRPDPDLTQFLNEITRLPVLPRAEETALVTLAKQGNQGAARRLCAHNLRFVVLVAKKHRGLGLPFKDLVNEGCVGMMKAITRYDPSAGHRLLSYAVWWIRQAIVLAVQEKARTIRVSSEHQPSVRRLRQSPLRQVIGGQYVEDVEAESERSGIRPEYLTASLGASKGGISLDLPSPDDGAPPADIIASQAPQPDQLTEQREMVDILNRLRGKLNPAQREVITRYYGMDNGAPMPLKEIAMRMGVSRQRIDQIKNEALSKMRAMSKPYGGK